MSKMIEDAIRDLELHKKSLTALVLIGDAEDFQITKVGLNGATTSQILGLIATLEMLKLDLIKTFKNGDGLVEDGDESEGSTEDFEDGYEDDTPIQ